MAANCPVPPCLPDTVEDFLAHVQEQPEIWLRYIHNAHSAISAPTVSPESGLLSENASLRYAITELQAKQSELQEKESSTATELVQARGVIQYQKENIRELQNRITSAYPNKDHATAQADTPVSTPLPATTPSQPHARSDKLPDPEVFKGDRKDIRRFLSQVSQKLRINQDRYPSPAARLAYVASRLSGPAYALVQPHIGIDGICHLSDYPAMLNLLERAYGDPNRIANARTELLSLRQKNQEFSSFYAEFQRLALEGELEDDPLATILEAAISQELRGMLMHSPPPSRELHAFAGHLQDLENRRRQYYQQPSLPAPQTSRPASPRAAPMLPSYASTAAHRIPSGDPMDLSTHRRRSDKDLGTCYRCHKSGHLVRDCPEPDKRPLYVRQCDEQARKWKTQSAGICTPSPPQSPLQLLAPQPVRMPTPPASYSENGHRLEEAVFRQ